jgi:hypothetical protein
MICDIWYDMAWHDMIWYYYNTIWYMTWNDYDTIRYMIWYMIWNIWYDIWHDMIWLWYDTIWYDMIYDVIYLLTAIGLTPSGSSTVHIYKQTIHRTTQSTQTIHRTAQLTNWEECGPCPVFVSYILAFALQLRKKHGKTSVRVAEECQLTRWKQNIRKRAYITIRIHKHKNKNT